MMMKKIIFVAVCLAVFSYSNTAFVRASDEWGPIPKPPPPTRVDPEPGNGGRNRDGTQRVGRHNNGDGTTSTDAGVYNKSLNEARQAVEASRKNAELSAEQAQSKGAELARLKDSMADPAEVDAANRRVQEMLRDQAKLTKRLARLQGELASNTISTSQGQVSFGTAVMMNEEDLYKKIGPIKVTPSMCKQAEKNYKSQQKEMDELKEQLRSLSKFSQDSEERISLEKQIQSKATCGLVYDLLDLIAPEVAKGSKGLRVSYEIAKAAVAAWYTRTAPDDVERVKMASASLKNLYRAYGIAAEHPTWVDTSKLKVGTKPVALALKMTSFTIEQDSKDKKNPDRLPGEICYDYMKLAVNFAGEFNPYLTRFHAGVSIKDRIEQYVYAEDAIKKIQRMKEPWDSAEAYIQYRTHQVYENMEASKRTISACKSGDRK